ncbi:MAG: hypothetical protein WDN49_15530 [Acetobacteraceae bacterium]
MRPRPPPSRDEKMRAGERPPIPHPDRHLLAGPPLHHRVPGGERQRDTVGCEDVLDRRRHVAVLAGSQLRAMLDDCDLAAEPPERLRHLHADIPAAEHEQPGRQDIERQRFDMRERRRLGQAGDRRDIGGGAKVDIDALAGQPPGAASDSTSITRGSTKRPQPSTSSRPLA